jgi:hypothetical protein
MYRHGLAPRPPLYMTLLLAYLSAGPLPGRVCLRGAARHTSCDHRS